MKDYFTTAETAQIIGISRVGVQQAIKRGALKAQKFGNKMWQVERESVLSYKRRYQPKPS